MLSESETRPLKRSEVNGSHTHANHKHKDTNVLLTFYIIVRSPKPYIYTHIYMYNLTHSRPRTGWWIKDINETMIK